MQQIEQLGGWEAAVFERVANAETQAAIAQSYGISQVFLSRLIKKDAEWTRAFREAKKAAATHYAEEAMSSLRANDPDVRTARRLHSCRCGEAVTAVSR